MYNSVEVSGRPRSEERTWSGTSFDPNSAQVPIDGAQSEGDRMLDFCPNSEEKLVAQ